MGKAVENRRHVRVRLLYLKDKPDSAGYHMPADDRATHFNTVSNSGLE